ncbi:MAG: TatD family hydrolase [Gemmatimonadales bacterium]
MAPETRERHRQRAGGPVGARDRRNPAAAAGGLTGPGRMAAPDLIDTHCHLADAAFQADVGEVVARMAAAGVRHAVVIGESPEAAARALDLVDRFPALSATAGLHPHEAVRWSAEQAAWLAAALNDPRVVAAGEMGLDYHYDHSPRDHQRQAFEAQLDLARDAGKPAVIHAREADDDVAAILENHPDTVAVMHSFSSGPGLLARAVALGHYVSLSGMLTFKNWRLDAALREVPLDRLLVETDAPYLAPVPHRGKRNEPGFVRETARRLGEVFGTTLDQIAEITTANAVRLFGPRLSTH